jgi:UDP-N-acetylmuramoyl-L-alanyl-D-glutamate--2,6-diaminopimelate ligase
MAQCRIKSEVDLSAMRIIDLIPNPPPYTPRALVLSEVNHITTDSREATHGTLFFAIEGTTRDGHDFVDAALKAGATAAVIRKDHPRVLQLAGLRCIEVDDPKVELGHAASRLNGNPSNELVICAVTGTNGKTTSTYLLESILNEWKKPTAVIGTVENRLGTHKIAATHTTPDAIALQKMLADFKNHGAKAVAIEVSSHALEQKRVVGTNFAAALFTNLTQDHLDYHGTLENYFLAKTKLFLDFPLQTRAIHADDEYGARLIEICEKRGFNVIRFGRTGHAVNYGALHLSDQGIDGTIDTIKGPIKIRSKLLGSFNAQNLAGAAAVAIGLGIPNEVIGNGLSKANPPPGRMETVPNKRNLTVVVDYAHTPDALENALKTLKSLCKNRLLCVFGCGGDRDPGKRPIMGAIAEKLADEIFVTSDNPRTEDPDAIVDAIFTGIKASHNAHRITDRARAIAEAIKALRPGDILLIAGKGHEDYQIIGTQKLPFDDRLIARENLEK